MVSRFRVSCSRPESYTDPLWYNVVGSRGDKLFKKLRFDRKLCTAQTLESFHLAFPGNIIFAKKTQPYHDERTLLFIAASS
ncbi:hypothetical protein RRG08_017060 [Elysia crispata]|uniref:Uncharacterized protein n=1 Tax=Elysia crispata TaxID=231223 RepID=A0AAE0ZB28_9GAST|nr:hypothetical protein RRG08_017060 [Elysia crispata]